jgi:hypothetical protein
VPVAADPRYQPAVHRKAGSRLLGCEDFRVVDSDGPVRPAPPRPRHRPTSSAAARRPAVQRLITAAGTTCGRSWVSSRPYGATALGGTAAILNGGWVQQHDAAAVCCTVNLNAMVPRLGACHGGAAALRNRMGPRPGGANAAWFCGCVLAPAMVPRLQGSWVAGHGCRCRGMARSTSESGHHRLRPARARVDLWQFCADFRSGEKSLPMN